MKDSENYSNWHKDALISDCIRMSGKIDALNNIIDSTVEERNLAIRQGMFMQESAKKSAMINTRLKSALNQLALVESAAGRKHAKSALDYATVMELDIDDKS